MYGRPQVGRVGPYGLRVAAQRLVKVAVGGGMERVLDTAAIAGVLEGQDEAVLGRALGVAVGLRSVSGEWNRAWSFLVFCCDVVLCQCSVLQQQEARLDPKNSWFALARLA
ncbi:hypothetical protein C2845_PM07G12210 [Panicum miliaceum]|uniref:Uncharacterized protein n=1 Tax=Panicum miliaceum TaxID=4540 RepID=A0A3L6SGK5_PANMI|nr:hypothetical protein C2845_PM07G12210 [Panicum miliaceum]